MVFGLPVIPWLMCLSLGPAPPSSPVQAAADPAPRVMTADAVESRSVPQRLGDVFEQVDLRDISARQFLEWWSQATGIVLLVNWDSLERQGIDPHQPVTLQLRRLPAGQVLALGMQMISNPPAVLMYEMTGQAMELLTKADANRRPVTRVYPVASLLHRIDDEPLPRVNTSGYALDPSRGTRTITMDVRGDGTMDRTRARQEAGERLVRQIMEMIGPSLWRENGGEHGSIRLIRDRLVVTAPRYAQNQVAEFLGIEGLEDLAAPGAAGLQAPVERSAARSWPPLQPISSVQSSRGSPVSGVQER